MLQNYDIVFFVVNIYRAQSKICPKNTSRIFNKQAKWNYSTSGKSEARKKVCKTHDEANKISNVGKFDESWALHQELKW